MMPAFVVVNVPVHDESVKFPTEDHQYSSNLIIHCIALDELKN